MSYLVKDYMDKTFSTVDAGASVLEAAKVIDGHEQAWAIVTEKGAPVGMISDIDIVSKVVVKELNPSRVTVREVMTSPLVDVDPDEDLMKASEIMQKNDVRRLAVVKGGIVYGIITSRDIAQGCGRYVDKAVKDILKWSFPLR